MPNYQVTNKFSKARCGIPAVHHCRMSPSRLPPSDDAVLLSVPALPQRCNNPWHHCVRSASPLLLLLPQLPLLLSSLLLATSFAVLPLPAPPTSPSPCPAYLTLSLLMACVHHPGEAHNLGVRYNAVDPPPRSTPPTKTKTAPPRPAVRR